MLHLMILLCILCTVPGNPFPQRSNPNFDSNFDFDDYLQHFQENPLDRTFDDNLRIAPDQDYRYTPLLGERPDYVPPIHERAHFPHPSIPRRQEVKHRAWHSLYQDGNFPHAGMQHAASGSRQQNPIQGQREFTPHLKMQDFGDHDFPVVEAFFKNDEHEIKNRHHKAPIVKEPSRGKPVFIKEHPGHPVKGPIVNKDYETPAVVEAFYKKSKPVSINHVKKQQIGIVDSVKVKHQSYPEDYEESVVVGAFTKVLPQHNRKHSHKKPVLKHGKRPIVKHHQNYKVKTTEVPVPSHYSEVYDTPVVVETFTKEKLPIGSKGHNHNQPIKGVHAVKNTKQKPVLQPDWKPIVTSYPEDYEAPVVVEMISKKESVRSEKHNIHVASPVKHEKNPIVKPIGKPIEPNYPDNYDVPVVVEALTKKGMVHHKKEHDHKKRIELEVTVKHEKKPVIKPPVEPNYDTYELPVVVETYTKGTAHKKEYGHKKTMEAELVIKHEKGTIIEPVEKPAVLSYPYDYDLPVVVETYTKRTVHKKEHDHKKPIKPELVVQHEKNLPIKPPLEASYPDTYELPVVVETYTKGTAQKKEHGHKKTMEAELVIKNEKGTAHKKEHGHKKIMEAELVIKHEKGTIIEPVEKPAIPSYPDDYDLPVVVETYTKRTVHKKKHGHKKPIKPELVVKHEKNLPIKPLLEASYPDTYELPVVVETYTKKTVQKEHGHKKPLEPELVVKNEKNPPMEPVKPHVEANYPDSYELPVVVETYTKGTAHKKEHDHEKTMKAELVIKHKKDTIVKPVEKPTVLSYPDDYDLPVVVEAYTKDPVHKKENSHKKPIVAELVAEKRHEKNPIVKSRNADDYEAPVVVETWTIPESAHNKQDKQSEEKPVWNKHSHEKVGKPIEELDDEEYEFEENLSEFNYEYGDSETKTDNYEHKTKPNYQGNIEGSQITKRQTQLPKSQFEESIIKRAKRQAELNHEYDYDLPVVVEVETRPPEAAGHKKPALMEPIDEYDYDLPVVVEVETRSPQVFSYKKTDFVKSEEYDYDHKKPEFVEPIDHEANYKFPEKIHPSIKIDEVYDLKNAKKPSKMDQEDNEEYEDINVEALTKGKRGTKKHGHKHRHKHGEKKATKRPHMGKKPYKEQIVITKKDEIPVDVYNQNKREPQMYFPTRVEPNVREDGYERPIDKHTDVNMHGHKIDVPEKPGDFIKEDNFITEENPIHDSFEPLDISDTEDVIDSISINRESSDGREIPVLDVLAVEHANDPNAGLKVMTFNKENGKVDLINIGHEESNLGIDSFEDVFNLGIDNFDDSGSGVDLDERSSGPRSFIPMNSNTWSFMTHVQAQERLNFKRCSTPKNETGNCMPIQMCPIPNAGGTIDEFLRNVCIIDEVFIGVCCPEFPVQSVRVDWGQLGHSNSEPLIDNLQTSRESLECGRLPASFQNEDSWPWMAHLISTTSDRVFCGGALISEQYVLTAAHCTSRIPRNRILVRLGSPDSQTGGIEFAVVEIKRHAHYNPKTMQNDIALLKLSSRVQLGNFRRPVCIPDGDMEDSVGDTAVLLRWQGNSGSGVESLPVISNQGCQNKLGTLIGDSVLCTEPRNEETTCNADSGAPLVVNVDGKFNIIGVLTWNRNDCDGRFPSVFTRISSYRKWIRNHRK